MKAKIYVIRNDIDECIYVGSTVQPLSKRFNSHRSRMHVNPNTKLYGHMHHIGVENFKIEPYEDVECDTRRDMRIREAQVIRMLGAELNMNVPGRDSKQYYEDNRDRIRDSYRVNRDAKLEYQRRYNAATSERRIEYQREYYVANRDKIREYQTRYRILRKVFGDREKN